MNIIISLEEDKSEGSIEDGLKIVTEWTGLKITEVV